MENYKMPVENLDLNALKQEISMIKEEEMAKRDKKEKYNLHFMDIDPKSLDDCDFIIYYKFREKILTKEEYDEYARTFVYVENNHDSRLNFKAWLAGQLCDLEWIEKWQPKRFEKHFKNKEKSANLPRLESTM